MDIRSFLIISLSILLLFTIGIAGYFYWQLETLPAPIPVPDLPSNSSSTGDETDNSVQIDLYYLTQDHRQFMIDSRNVLQSDTIPGRIRRALEEWMIRKKVPGNLILPIPEGTQLQSVIWYEEERRVYVSFSPELIENNPGHTLSEWATIYSIVNTVAAQSPLIKEVHILVDGEIIPSSKTIWDWSKPFEPDKTYVRFSPIVEAH